ncbi:uncharacterized protein CIMG_13631 [Coccidioides immitis RS]|uniref:Uncharacterized protein n=1 Tax=Coccidioides immitis (strain RS) TaxID=246410 RepID=A0A0D8JWU3_COCIM|nr:uncharacterized protein CIMG_13631 [Coccidioides immitis RS]KJF61406.1 hypothetical protein CIMG_13631 [Coccidioides immitis RS]
MATPRILKNGGYLWLLNRMHSTHHAWPYLSLAEISSTIMSLQVLDEHPRFNLRNIQQMRCRTTRGRYVQSTEYYIIKFSTHQKPRLNPLNIRGKQKVTLGCMLQDYVTDCYCNADGYVRVGVGDSAK